MGTPRPDFRLLGSLQVWYEGAQVDVGLRRERLILGALLLERGRAVPLDRLVELTWADEPPPRTARNAVQVSISRLRTALGRAATIETEAHGYRLVVPPECLDLGRFRALVTAARGLDDARAAATLRDAELLWRGPVLAGTFPDELRSRLCTGLQEERLVAIEERMDIELRRGRHATVLGELNDLVRDHPTRERLVGALMLALYRSGHVARALEVFQLARTRLAEELGIDPGPRLCELELAILQRSPLIDAPAPAPDVPTAVRVPAQLPLGLRGFTGRHDALARLDAILGESSGQPTSTTVVVLSGTAGVGKTTLALHWAHRVTDRFPDGQLYVNLQGYHPGGPPVQAADVLWRFLTALGVTPQRITATVAERATLYRTMLGGRRVLVVLDNARDAEQIRPLLPGSPSSMVLVTSRNGLPSLVTAEGAASIAVDLLTSAEAVRFLTNRLGTDRVAAEQVAAEDIVALCSRLPLALGIVTARAATHPRFALSDLADELRDGHGRLDRLSGEDLATDLRTVFSWSYHALGPEAARLFRLLGLTPGPDVGHVVAAVLSGTPVEATRRHLTELTAANLVIEHAPGRFMLHDLLRIYARELAHRLDAPADREAATHRLLDHLLRTAANGAVRLHPRQIRFRLAPARGVPHVVELPDAERAMAWFAAEHDLLVAAVEHACDSGLDAHAWQLAWVLTDFLERQGHWQKWAATQRSALAAAQRLGDPAAQAFAHRGMARALSRLTEHHQAEVHLRAALSFAERTGDKLDMALSHNNLAVLSDLLGRQEEAVEHTALALNLYTAAGDPIGQASAMGNLGWYYSQLGRHEEAAHCCRQAVALHREVGNQSAEAGCWHSLGYALHHLGRHDEAIECFERAVDMCVGLGEVYDLSMAYTPLGDAQQAAGDAAAARRSWQQALTILEDLAHPDAAGLRRRLTVV